MGGEGRIFLSQKVTSSFNNEANIGSFMYLLECCPEKKFHTHIAEGLLNSGGQGCNPSVTPVPIHFPRLILFIMKSVYYLLFNVDSWQLLRPAKQNKKGKTYFLHFIRNKHFLRIVNTAKRSTNLTL